MSFATLLRSRAARPGMRAGWASELKDVAGKLQASAWQGKARQGKAGQGRAGQGGAGRQETGHRQKRKNCRTSHKPATREVANDTVHRLAVHVPDICNVWHLDMASNGTRTTHKQDAGSCHQGKHRRNTHTHTRVYGNTTAFDTHRSRDVPHRFKGWVHSWLPLNLVLQSGRKWAPADMWTCRRLA